MQTFNSHAYDQLIQSILETLIELVERSLFVSNRICKQRILLQNRHLFESLNLPRYSGFPQNSAVSYNPSAFEAV